MSYLGIDLGTSGLRALLIDEEGRVIGSAESPYSVEHPHTGWSEQDPGVWIDALEDTIGQLKSLSPAFSDLKGIGVAGHMHGATLMGANDSVLRPCILWNDTRSQKQAQAMDVDPSFRSISGNIVFPGFTAPKLAWVKDNEPEIFDRTSKVLLPAAFLNHYLSGEYVADMSDSAGTAWLDVEHRKWSPTLLEKSGMRADQMPRLVEGSEQAGQLRPTLANKWGVSKSVIVAGGAGDNAAAACGIGALNEGQGFVSLGTSGVVLAASDGYRPAPETAVHTFCHAVPERWYQMGVMLSATDSLNWLARITGKKAPELTSMLPTALQTNSPEKFLPYLSGERTPHNDAEVRGAFTGLSTDTSVEDLTISVLNGVTFGLRDSFEAIKATGTKLDSLMAIGGGSGSAYWTKLIATVFDLPIHLPDEGEFGAALGAARLGLLASSGAPVSDIVSAPRIETEILPDVALTQMFEDQYQHFKSVFPAIKAAQ